ncbi:unnamed protein product [Linum trigynum]|uniref:Reverse transcriptase zinc-binding domain-containing protein n=1 Tax=Linum trigynum TaxID=586398 RepID=A0AAV2F812_9ROSI
MVNLTKSEVSFSPNLNADTRTYLAEILGMKQVVNHQKYLGLPTVVGRQKKEVFGVLVEKVRKKIKHWKGKMLSVAAKEVLIKSVAQAQATYTMSVFQVPDGVIDELRKAISSFWWGQQKEERRITWKAWKKLCKPKEEGGLDFRDLKTFNLALLGKQIWNLLQNPTSLAARVLKAKYYPNSDVLQARVGYNPSFTWRSLMAAQTMVKEGLRWIIGDGRLTNIWQDRWLANAEEDGYKVTTPQCTIGGTSIVAELIDHESRMWKSNILQQHFNAVDRARIQGTPIPRQPAQDERIWSFEKNGKFSVRTAYRYWFKKNTEKEIHWEEVDVETEEQGIEVEAYDPMNWKRLWKLIIPPKVKIFLWKLAHNILPTGKNLESRKRDASPNCPFCGLEETQNHIFRECDWAVRIWKPTPLRNFFELDGTLSPGSWLCEIMEMVDDDTLGQLGVLLWFMWFERNNQCFNNHKAEEWEIAGKAYAYWEEYQNQNNQGPIQVEERSYTWKKPPEGWLKMNIDAAVMAGQGTGYGAVVRDERGNFRYAAIRRERAQWSPEIAEIRAIQFGLRLKEMYDLQQIVVETDCQPVFLSL